MTNLKTRSSSALRSPQSVIENVADPDSGVKSAVRVLRVLEFFDEIQRDARVGEIVEHLSMPQSSTSALLKSLVQMGYLDYSPTTRTYLPTAQVALLGSWIGGAPMRDGSLIRMMEELSAETGETILLAGSKGIYAKYLHVIQATNPVRIHVPVGAQRLLARSAMGVVLLSDTPPEAIRLLVRRTNAEAPMGQKNIDVRQTLANIEAFKEQGYFFSRGMVTPGAAMICMSLPFASGRPLALGIGGVLGSLENQEARLVRLMRAAIKKYMQQGEARPEGQATSEGESKPKAGGRGRK
ncbi:MAG: helix-turn-helix domain-containing protein [Rhodocyclaceae bacterium]|jgi:DNA-binding IclR family transcriptional regulator|nr:helix-turn-helix domain-containing protein [Rhodocyclaceae bacterium]